MNFDSSSHTPLESGSNKNDFIKRFNKVMYLGAGKDPFPLPLAKNAIYVDPMNKSMELFIQRTKEFYPFLEEPIVKWTTIEDRPVAKIVFKWDQIGQLTRIGDTTELTYLLHVDDIEMATNDNFKVFFDQVDVVYLSAFTPIKESLKHVDREKAILATGWVWDDPEIFSTFKKFHKYYHSKTIATRLFAKKISPDGFSDDDWNILLDGYKHEDLWTDMAQVASSMPISYKEWLAQSQDESVFKCFKSTICATCEDVKLALKGGQDGAKHQENVAKLIRNMSNVNGYVCEYPYLYPIHFAVSIDNFEISKELCQHLINNGANVNIRCHQDLKTPLHLAVENKHFSNSEVIEIMSMLINNGADIDAVEEFYGTVLHYVIARRNEEIFQFLIENGAKLNVRNYWGNTPYELAAIRVFGFDVLENNNGLSNKSNDYRQVSFQTYQCLG